MYILRQVRSNAISPLEIEVLLYLENKIPLMFSPGMHLSNNNKGTLQNSSHPETLCRHKCVVLWFDTQMALSLSACLYIHMNTLLLSTDNHKKHNSMFFKQEHKCEPCSRNCAICPYIRNTHTFTNFEGKTFNVKNYVNCTTANVAYVLFCKHCDKFIYIGETGDTLYQRHLLNLSLIRRQKPDPIVIHFNSTEHSVNDYEIVALETICGDNSYRDNRKTVDE
jgi:hypothetical protein